MFESFVFSFILILLLKFFYSVINNFPFYLIIIGHILSCRNSYNKVNNKNNIIFRNFTLLIKSLLKSEHHIKFR